MQAVLERCFRGVLQLLTKKQLITKTQGYCTHTNEKSLLALQCINIITAALSMHKVVHLAGISTTKISEELYLKRSWIFFGCIGGHIWSTVNTCVWLNVIVWVCVLVCATWVLYRLRYDSSMLKNIIKIHHQQKLLYVPYEYVH